MREPFSPMAALVVASLSGCVPHLYSAGKGGGGPWTPPDNTWDLAEPPSDLAGEGFDGGEVPPDLRLTDQHGDEVSLWQFYGKVVLLDISTMWCAPCREIAQDAQATQDEFGPEGFVYVTVLQQNVDGGAPTVDDLRQWADYYGIAAPVLGDGAAASGGAIQNGQFPAVLVLDRRMRVDQRVNPIDAEQIRRDIEAAL